MIEILSLKKPGWQVSRAVQYDQLLLSIMQNALNND